MTEAKTSRLERFSNSRLWNWIGVLSLAGMLFLAGLHLKDARYEAEVRKTLQLVTDIQAFNNSLGPEAVNAVRYWNQVLVRVGYGNFGRVIQIVQPDTTKEEIEE